MSNRFLFELGTEEIPADMIAPALLQMTRFLEGRLEESQVGHGTISTYDTPRRLALIVEGLPVRQPDRREVIAGPPVSVAMKEDGSPAPAGIGFARKLGVEFSELSPIETARGTYLGLERTVEGKPVKQILADTMPGLVASISWPKSMYWSESRFRFIRPLRWFVCLWNDEVVPFVIEGVQSGRMSRGHRFLGSSEIEIGRVAEYVDRLEKGYVLVSEAERRRRIEEGLLQAAGEYKVQPDPDLLEIVIRLNEYPTVLRGSFSADFLRIPEEVLVTVMRFHQKYFSLLDGEGNLVPAFLTVVNTSGDKDGRIRRGHEKVLQARLEDAAFFWNSDQKTALRDRVESLASVLFQEKLGSYLDKTHRIQAVCRLLDESEELQEAALLSKADLTTDMVRELTELQGVMGGLYARAEGRPDAVWKAVYEHYRPISADDELPTTRNGILLSIADRIDTLAGCFCAGIVPSGSSDPFALRRLAQGLVSLLATGEILVTLGAIVDAGLTGFAKSATPEVRDQLLDFLGLRVDLHLQREGIANDVIRAVFAVGLTSVPDAVARAQALSRIRGDRDFEALAVSFKRTRNILEKARDHQAIEESLFEEEAERDLYRALAGLRPRLDKAIGDRDYLTALREMAGIRGTVDRFFDDVLVMAEDTRVRANRLALLGAVSDLFLTIADLSEIVQQGGGDSE